jgi:hypothetical protein
MLIVLLFAALVAVVFAVQLTRQFARRRRPHALAWPPTPAIDRQPARRPR